MCVGTPDTPPPPPALPEAPRTPDTGGAAAGDTSDRRRRAASRGRSGTVLTSPRGVQDGGQTAAKTLLGQ